MSTTILKYHLRKLGECSANPSRCWEGIASLEFVTKHFQEVAGEVPDFERQALQHALTKLRQYFTYGSLELLSPGESEEGELTKFDAWIYSRFIREQLWKL